MQKVRNRLMALIGLASCLLCATGCHWFRRRPPIGPLPPVVWTQPPQMSDVLFTINDNTRRVTQLQTENAKLRFGTFKLNASLALNGDKDFRLKARLTSLTGADVDMGSNGQMMWMWTKWHPDPAVYFVYRDDFERGAAREMIPVDPGFLTEALGLVHLDPNQQHDGPYPAGPNRLQIISRMPSATGELTRLTVVDSQYGWVLEQHLRDATGRVLASAFASQHRFYEGAGVSLPHDVKIMIAPGSKAEMAMRLEVRTYFINQLVGNPAVLFALPEIQGYAQVNLGGRATVSPPPTSTSTNGMRRQDGTAPASPAYGQSTPAVQPANYVDDVRFGYQPRYRGDTWRR